MKSVSLRTYGVGQTTGDYLSLISQYESANQNIPNYRYDPTHTAQGYYQITMTNWNSYAAAAGVDTSQYPTPMSAPQDVQAQVASYMLTNTPSGISNWANFNAPLNAALTSAGMQTSGPIVDVSGSAAATPTSSILDQLSSQASTVGIDVTDPTTLVVMGVAAVAAVFLIGGRR